MKYQLETCAGSLKDCIVSEKAGATRIELNSGVHMGGLTPSMGLVHQVLKTVHLPIIAMVRPRGGGFIYHSYDQKVMFEDAKMLLEAGVDGLAFGFLNESLAVDEVPTKKMVQLCHDYGAEAVFHRAFDRSRDMDEAMKTLIEIGVDRVLTSGQEVNVDKGLKNLAYLQSQYGHHVEICAGAGVHADNIKKLMTEAGIYQVHGSFKSWEDDLSTHSAQVSYQYAPEGDYEIVDYEKVLKAVEIIGTIK